MKSKTLVMLSRIREVNSSLEHRWKNKHNDDAISNASYNIIVGRIFMGLALVCVGIGLWEKPSLFPISGKMIIIVLCFLVTFYICLVNLLARSKFGTRLEELRKLFACNFGELALMTMENMANKAEGILDDLAYQLIYMERTYKPSHPVEVAARDEYNRVLAVFEDLGIHDGVVDDIFVRANERYVAENQRRHPLAVAPV